ncbi:hypothetical protein NPIL_696641 [Nephila pilipes]|uniref:Uncharacterized protein n=1 Tax=Nephila pilipes TaxID=299642 RepID=A0A8X6N8H5_NEPPI|nr:hypothetical protein NPIL_696641 [Nephila pilipes]
MEDTETLLSFSNLQNDFIGEYLVIREHDQNDLNEISLSEGCESSSKNPPSEELSSDENSTNEFKSLHSRYEFDEDILDGFHVSENNDEISGYFREGFS